MKPITTLTIYSRHPNDRESITKVGVVGFESIGEGSIILTRDEMGQIIMESADIKPDGGFTNQLDEAVASLTALHKKLGELHITTQYAMSDMFAVNKWLTRP